MDVNDINLIYGYHFLKIKDLSSGWIDFLKTFRLTCCPAVPPNKQPPRPRVCLVYILFDKTMICKTCTVSFPKSIQNDNWSMIKKVNERKPINIPKVKWLHLQCVGFFYLCFLFKRCHTQCQTHPVFVFPPFHHPFYCQTRSARTEKLKIT